MPTRYEEAVSALYRAAHESFVSERRRLAAELKAEGDKAGAAQLTKLGRPPISAWAVNQLWWQSREDFDELFETAAQLRRGKLSVSSAHRKLIAKLAARAGQLLSEGGHSANDATLRRVAMTLSGLAAAGSFDPDLPGALTKDREPPGFEAFGIASSSDEQEEHPAAREKPAPAAPLHLGKSNGKAQDNQSSAADKRREAADFKRANEAEAAERKREAAEAAERKREAAEAAERKREAEAQAKRQAQRKKLESELRDAKAELAEREEERARIAKQLATAERELERARARVDAAHTELDEYQ
jgi:hypothetical protein